MKRLIPLIFALPMLRISCGKASKAKPLIEDTVETYKAANRSGAIRYLKTKNRIEIAENIYNSYISSSPCSMCNGYGIVYKTVSMEILLPTIMGMFSCFFARLVEEVMKNENENLQLIYV